MYNVCAIITSNEHYGGKQIVRTFYWMIWISWSISQHHHNSWKLDICHGWISPSSHYHSSTVGRRKNNVWVDAHFDSHRHMAGVFGDKSANGMSFVFSVNWFLGWSQYIRLSLPRYNLTIFMSTVHRFRSKRVY